MSLTWDEAAAQVHDRWMAEGKLNLPPDDPSDDPDDVEFFDEVEALVKGESMNPPPSPPKA
jgi:hypothetical protein